MIMTAFIRIAWIDRLLADQVLRRRCASGENDSANTSRRPERRVSIITAASICRRYLTDVASPSAGQRHLHRRCRRLIVLVHDGGSRFAASEMQSRASRSMTMSTICCRHKRATAVLSTKQPTSRSKTIAVHPLRRDRFLAPLLHLEGLSHYRPPQPPVFAIDEHSSCIHRKRATAVLVVRNSASESGAHRREGCRRVCILPDGAHAMLARRHAGMRVESV